MTNMENGSLPIVMADLSPQLGRDPLLQEEMLQHIKQVIDKRYNHKQGGK